MKAKKQNNLIKKIQIIIETIINAPYLIIFLGVTSLCLICKLIEFIFNKIKIFFEYILEKMYWRKM